ncbi:hypothetical protein L1987_30806 [Smallanthus sonchifolius]|uniref:Uncharacterized protein n=1 Tax=Smallanthus sonchifolius TaxID=185202 RepID=A0ACB9I3U0_9ASTR|nr:hypothetical protein L1987_30806 [Smallanthus sonchifolius]
MYRSVRLTRKSDVYAFGVLLLEVLCRKPELDECLYGEGRNLVAWAKDSIKEWNLKHIIDSDIKGEISPKCSKKFVSITERCLLKDPDLRPTIADVVASLETTLALQEKFNIQAASSRTIFGRMVDMLPENTLAFLEPCRHDFFKK